MKTLLRTSAAAAAILASPAFAHDGPPGHTHVSFVAGLLHPFTGIDHVLAMVAVGLWAAMLGGRALFIVPASFVGVMVLGFISALLGLQLPFVEPIILASVVMLGLAIATALPVRPLVGAAIVGFFAFFHGHAHGSEMAGSMSLAYVAGFVLATMVLHAAGIGLGLGAGRWLPVETGRLSMRILGGATAIGGILLMVS